MGKRGGRKPKLNAAVQAIIVDQLRAGAFRAHAARAAGVAESTVDAWLRRGDAGERNYRDFAREVRRAQAEDAIRSQAIITRAAFGLVDGDWRAAAWALERKHPKEYGRSAGAAAVAAAAVHEDERAEVVFYAPGVDWRAHNDS
jgi:hypothetical protein